LLATGAGSANSPKQVERAGIPLLVADAEQAAAIPDADKPKYVPSVRHPAKGCGEISKRRNSKA
jgi:hypothetical protein